MSSELQTHPLPGDPCRSGSEGSARNQRPSEERDQQLVAAALAGDPDSLDALYRAYSPRVYHYGLQRLRNHDDAEDLTQEVFIRVIQSLPSYQGRSRLLTWIFGIANFLALRQIHNKHQKMDRITLEEAAEIPDYDGAATPEQIADATQLLERCERVLQTSVAPNGRMIFQMRYAEDASMARISKQLGVSVGSVKSSLRNTRRVLFQKARNGHP